MPNHPCISLYVALGFFWRSKVQCDFVEMICFCFGHVFCSRSSFCSGSKRHDFIGSLHRLANDIPEKDVNRWGWFKAKYSTWWVTRAPVFTDRKEIVHTPISQGASDTKKRPPFCYKGPKKHLCEKKIGCGFVECAWISPNEMTGPSCWNINILKLGFARAKFIST